MEITRRYTMENWKTGHIELLDIPKEVLELSTEDAFKSVFSSSIVNLNFVEHLFFLIFNHEGWRVMRLPFGSNYFVKQYIEPTVLDNLGIIRESLHGKGTPDLLIWKVKEKKSRFIE